VQCGSVEVCECVWRKITRKGQGRGNDLVNPRHNQHEMPERRDSHRNVGYKSLLQDDNFSNLNLLKVRRLIGLGLSEMLGTAMFVGLGCGDVVAHALDVPTTHLNTVLSFAFGISAAIAIFGPISGALMNPSLNVSALILGHMSIQKAIFYTIFQMIGATLGVGIVRSVVGEVGENFCTNQLNTTLGVGPVLVVEFVTTGLLCLGLCAVLDPRSADHKGHIYLKFAILVTAIAIPSGKFGGCSMNPARTFGAAVLSSYWDHQWLFWVGPLSGAAVATTLYRVFFDEEIFVEKKVTLKAEANPI